MKIAVPKRELTKSVRRRTFWFQDGRVTTSTEMVRVEWTHPLLPGYTFVLEPHELDGTGVYPLECLRMF